MDNKICCFAGHGDAVINTHLYDELKKSIESLICKGITEFWVGNYGKFDATAANCLFELKKTHTQIKSFLVIPYLTKKTEIGAAHYQSIYDGIIIADIPAATPKKFMISKCNQYMINSSEYLICFVKHTWGGAAKTLEYAKKKKLIITNIADKVSS